ncbi:cytochrome P450 [Nocardia veterana]|uniref:Cytochrome P450 n=1 Tax=Nocardia veterana TaxID=132249 RepID=A0A7X6RJF6_9NOCA|nr:cytochrome P450 [Nocardia veterana]NKY87529.1 cytochrome P450 [Nocardia veterana]
MSTPPGSGRCPIEHGPPPRNASPFPITGQQFAADPHAVFRDMRSRHHSHLVPVDIGGPATLVIDYRLGLEILNDEDRYPTEPVAGSLPPASLGSRRDALHTRGDDRRRLRRAISDSLARVDTLAVERTVARAAVGLVNSFCEAGETDIVACFAIPLVAEALHGVFGIAPEVGGKIIDALLMMQSADPASAVRGRSMLREVVVDTVLTKRTYRGADVASWLMEHPAGLSDEEIVEQLLLLCEFIAPTWALISNAVLLVMTDKRFGGDVLGGALSGQDAIDEVLHKNPPIAVAAPRFPRQMQVLDNIGTLPENRPLLVGLAACNADPAVMGEDRRGNRAHLAFGAGAHMCPAEPVATLIARSALDQLLDALPDLELAVSANDLVWVDDPFSLALVSLPVRFPPATPFPLA